MQIMSSVDVYFDVSVGDAPPKRLKFALDWKCVPRTAENFRSLCAGDNTEGLTYRGSKFHRVIHGFMAQGGDITRGDGTGGQSIYGSTFPDEDLAFKSKHSGRGILSMANRGPNTNSSQFFILFGAAPHLDGKHTVFGRVIEGLNVLDEIEAVNTKSRDVPATPIQVVDCGVVGKRSNESKDKRQSSKYKNKRSRSSSSSNSDSECDSRTSCSSVSSSNSSTSASISSSSTEGGLTAEEEQLMEQLLKREKELEENLAMLSGGRRPTASASDKVPDDCMHNSKRQRLSRSGRTLKGRGHLRYRTPSPQRSSYGSRSSRSITRSRSVEYRSHRHRSSRESSSCRRSSYRR